MKYILDDLALDYELLVHFTPTAAQRQAFVKSGAAMPDGSFYITNAGQLSDAIRAVGRATPNAGESETARRNSVRRHIIKRARAIKRPDMIPDTWNSDGTLKQSGIPGLPPGTIVDEKTRDWLEHFGVRGMRWGVRRQGGGSSGGFNPAGANHPSLTAPKPGLSSDASVARGLQSVAKTRGTGALSNKELQTLVTRQSLERQYSSLNPKQVSAGKKFLSDTGKDMARQSAQTLIKQFGPKGAKWLAKRGGMAITSLAVRGALAAL